LIGAVIVVHQLWLADPTDSRSGGKASYAIG
jgi:hypothetical protein